MVKLTILILRQMLSSGQLKISHPGGYLPTLRQMMQAIEKTTLKVTDVEITRLHYAETLSH